MDTFVGFSQENVELVEKFANSLGIWMEPATPVKIETNNNENDTILFGEYSIIKDESGKYQAYYTHGVYSREHGPESVEVELDGPTNFYRALGVCAKNDFEAKLGTIFESLIPQESEPQG